MTKQELCELGLKGAGRVHAKGDTIAPILPYLLADIALQCQTKGEKAIGPLRHEQKQKSRIWHKQYTLFNRPFFSLIPPENQEEMTDLMDSLYESISNEVMMLQSGILLMFDGADFNQRKNVSWFMLAHIFSQFANAAWKNVNYHVKHAPYGDILEPETNDILNRLRDISFSMAMAYLRGLPGKGEITISSLKQENLFGVISKKIYDWLKQN